MAPNLLDYILQAKGWLCLAVEFGLLNREVVGWSLKPRMKADIVIEALTMASFRRPAPARPDSSLRSRRPEHARFYGARYKTIEKTIANAFDYIEPIYNRSRKHSTLGYESPRKFLNEWIRR